MGIDPELYFSGAGGEVDESSVLLRFFGAELEPNAITDLLGISPTLAVRRGEIRPDRPWSYPVQKGCWLLECQRSPQTIDDHIKKLFADLPNDLTIWTKLSADYSAEIKCNLFLKRWCRATIIAADTIEAIAARRLGLHMDVYTPHDLCDLYRDKPHHDVNLE